MFFYFRSKLKIPENKTSLYFRKWDVLALRLKQLLHFLRNIQYLVFFIRICFIRILFIRKLLSYYFFVMINVKSLKVIKKGFKSLISRY